MKAIQHILIVDPSTWLTDVGLRDDGIGEIPRFTGRFGVRLQWGNNEFGRAMSSRMHASPNCLHQLQVTPLVSCVRQDALVNELSDILPVTSFEGIYESFASNV
jgi:hypothetical protein